MENERKKEGSEFNTGEEKSRMSTPEFLNLAAAVWPRRSHYFFNLIDKMKRPGTKGLGTCYLHFIGLFAKNSRSDKTQASVSRERGLDREALGIRGLSNCFSHRACRPFIQWKEGLDVCMRRGVRKEEMRKERRAGERSKSGSGGQVRDKGRVTFSF